MTDLITDPVLVSQQIKTRAKRIVITNTRGIDPNLNFESEKLLIIDGKDVASLPATNVIRNMAGVATQIITYTEPVTGQTITISAAGIAKGIEEFYCNWVAEDDARRAEAEAVRQKALAAAEEVRLAAEEAAKKAEAARLVTLAEEEEAARIAAAEEVARIAAEEEAAGPVTP